MCRWWQGLFRACAVGAATPARLLAHCSSNPRTLWRSEPTPCRGCPPSAPCKCRPRQRARRRLCSERARSGSCLPGSDGLAARPAATPASRSAAGSLASPARTRGTTRHARTWCEACTRPPHQSTCVHDGERGGRGGGGDQGEEISIAAWGRLIFCVFRRSLLRHCCRRSERLPTATGAAGSRGGGAGCRPPA